MKVMWITLVISLLINLLSTGLALYALSNKANQGIVESEDGSVWKLKRMQTLGLAGEYVAVYGKER